MGILAQIPCAVNAAVPVPLNRPFRKKNEGFETMTTG